MSLPWGVNQSVNPEKATEVTEFVSSLKDQSITLPSDNIVTIIKADVKDRKGKYLLIFRYEITQRA